MKISTTTDHLATRFGDEKALVMLAKAGFDAVDYSMFIHNAETGIFNTPDFIDYVKRLKTVANAANIKFGQFHAQIPSPSYPDYIERQDLWDKLALNSIIAADIVECPYVVIHPLIMLDRIYDEKYQENFDANIEYFGKMIPHIEKYGVKVAIENMWNFDDEKKCICPTVCSTSDEMLKLQKALGDGFVFCLDTGHTLLTGTTPDKMVYELGDKLKVLHVHDNNGVDDNHDLPYNGFPTPMMFPEPEVQLDWDLFTKALKDTGYKGTLSLEADCFFDKFPDEICMDVAKFMAKVARHLADKAE